MKVVVIADDLSGAAELATAAANLGHRCEVQTHFDPATGADLIALDTNTRLLPPSAAAQIVGDVTREIGRSAPDWIYKKTDSVLRGNVRAEIEAVMAVAGLTTALLISANPSKGRVVRKGMYYIDGIPLAQTAFAADPWHPRRSSDVLELLGATGSAQIVQSSDLQDEKITGIAVPDVEDLEDFKTHAANLASKTLPAGGVDFFSALVEKRCGDFAHDAGLHSPELPKPVFFVCGSHAAWQQGRHAQCRSAGVPVLSMPRASFSSSDAQAIEEWSREIEQVLCSDKCAMAAIGSMNEADRESQPSALTDRFIEAIALLLRRNPPATICVEGGATAAALFCRMEWTRLQAFPAPHFPGVSILQSPSPHAPRALIKPGSYPWPELLWRSLQISTVSKLQSQ